MTLSVLSKSMYMLTGKKNTYLIHKHYDGGYNVIPVNNNTEAKPLIICKTLDESLQFLELADSAVPAEEVIL